MRNKLHSICATLLGKGRYYFAYPSILVINTSQPLYYEILQSLMHKTLIIRNYIDSFCMRTVVEKSLRPHVKLKTFNFTKKRYIK